MARQKKTKVVRKKQLEISQVTINCITGLELASSPILRLVLRSLTLHSSLERLVIFKESGRNLLGTNTDAIIDLAFQVLAGKDKESKWLLSQNDFAAIHIVQISQG